MGLSPRSLDPRRRYLLAHEMRFQLIRELTPLSEKEKGERAKRGNLNGRRFETTHKGLKSVRMLGMVHEFEWL